MPSGRRYSQRVVADWFADLLTVLEDDRRAHLEAAGRKAAEAAQCVPPGLRPDLVAAVTLHDIGYGHPRLGFHPLDGAAYLAELGFSPVVCHLVAHHSASTIEADERVRLDRPPERPAWFAGLDRFDTGHGSTPRNRHRSG